MLCWLVLLLPGGYAVCPALVYVYHVWYGVVYGTVLYVGLYYTTLGLVMIEISYTTIINITNIITLFWA